MTLRFSFKSLLYSKGLNGVMSKHLSGFMGVSQTLLHEMIDDISPPDRTLKLGSMRGLDLPPINALISVCWLLTLHVSVIETHHC